MTAVLRSGVDARAQRRLYVLQPLDAGRISADEAGRILELSVRPVRRLLATYRADGLAGLVHGNRGRAPGHRTPDELRERLVELARTTYAGVNRAHLAELLAEREAFGSHGPPGRPSWPSLPIPTTRRSAPARPSPPRRSRDRT